jgi:ferredoxin-NADP reductase
MDLLNTVYLRNFKHPQGGMFTQYIDRIQPGAVMHITGIGGDMVYQGDSQFLVRDRETKEMVQRRYKNVGMIAGGSGIAPMFQLIQTVADLGVADRTSLSLLYSNRTPVSGAFFVLNTLL